jgi:hypothetical protein
MTQVIPNVLTQQSVPLLPVALGRKRRNLIVLTLYASLSFIFLFTVNYLFETRAYHQLDSTPQLFAGSTDTADAGRALQRKSSWKGSEVFVPDYHERYGDLSAMGLTVGVSTIFVLGISLGVVAALEERKRRSWRELLFIAIYVVPSFVMHYWFYPDMVGTIIVSWIYLPLFFVIRAIQHFNPHLLLASKSGEIEPSKHQILLNLYQRYFISFIAVLGFVAASFLVTASSLIQSMYSRSGEFGAKEYAAVHMPYLSAIYFLAGFASLALGFGVVQELHEKIGDLLWLTPVDLRSQGRVE